MENVKYNLKWNHSWNDEGVQEDIEFNLGKIANEMAKMYTTSCVVLVIKDCDHGGSYDTMDIHVFADFLEANDMINKEMYTSHNLDIYQYNCIKNTFVRVMDKCYDSFRFDRPAAVNVNSMFDDQFRFRMRKVFNMKETKVTLHPTNL